MPHALAHRLGPATAFLLQVCCQDRATGNPPEPAASPQELVKEARRQMVSGLLLQWALQNPQNALSQPIGEALVPSRQADAMRALGLVAETRKLVLSLEGAGIPVIPLKGPLLARKLYGDYGIRHLGDIDLLVNPQNAAAADRLLRENGYVRTKPQTDLSPRRLELYLRTQHEFGYRAAIGPIGLELHWRYTDCPGLQPASFDELRSRATSVDVGGAAVETLGTADTFMQLAIHGFTDGWSRLKWIADLPRALALLSEGELREVQERAQQGGLGRVVDLAVWLATETATALWMEPVLAHIAVRLQNPHPRTLPTRDRIKSALGALNYEHSLIEAAALRRAVAYCNLIMPADFDRLPLPDPLTPALPYLARIQRALKSLSSFGQ